MTDLTGSRYAAVSRRAALGGSLGAAMLALAACGNNDSSTLGTGSAGTKASTTTTPTTATTGKATSSAGGAAVGSGTPLPASAKLEVAFTFAVAAGGGMARNPYIAVWLEDSSGALVKTVALWHESRGGQDRWLSEMKEFSGLNATDAQTVSSATKQPGSYTVQWDGSTIAGARAGQGAYRLFVEAAREHGPYELVQQDVTLGAASAAFTLTPKGELTTASAKYTV